jgi:hypothetical protein
MSEFIPHQLHLTRPQMTKLMKGQGVNIPHAHMGSDKGSAVMMLHPGNAKRLLTGFRKSKGVRIALSPAEMSATISHGRGFNIGKAFKKLGKDISRGAKKTFTPKLGRDIVSGLEKAGKTTASALIHAGIPAVAGLAGDALGGPAGGVAGAIAGDMLADQVGKATGYGLYGGAHLDPASARKQYMAMIRSMRGMSEADKVKMRGSGLFKMLHKIGISKKSAIKGIKDVGKKAVRYGATALGTAIGAYAGNPVAGAMIGDALGRAGEVGLDSMQPSKHGVRFDKGEAVSSLKKDMRTLAKDKLEELIDTQVPREYQDIAHRALEGERLDTLAGETLQNKMNAEMRRLQGDGVRPRGRPRKLVGTGASNSSAFKQALMVNYNGLKLASADDSNSPVSDFKVNPNVRPSTSEMTLSPYQAVTSPAMNPFVPTRYTQMGGTQSGYGGRGLYGGGLYGGGLYGGGLF